MGNLTKRLLTAAVLVPILVVALFVDPTPWGILAAATLAGGFAHEEFLRMALPVTDQDRAIGLRAIVVLMGSAIIVLSCVYGPARALPATLTISMLLIGLAILVRKHALENAARHLLACTSSLLYVALLASVWALMKAALPNGASWLFVTLGVAFGSDTMAYTFGRLFGKGGKHKLYPEVSPKKTWEGSFGGLVGGVISTVGLGSLWLLPELPIGHAVVLGVVGSAFGQVGDLVESMLKRGFGVKDSGNLLPGHGGMLDRVDGLLFVAPVVYYYVTLILPTSA